MWHCKFVLSDIKRLPKPPKHIDLLGQLQKRDEKNIVVIGSRSMSDYGKNVIKCFVPELVKDGYTIVSGLAMGCDSYAQDVALECGGRTIGILGYGIDFIRKDKNNRFIEKVLASKNGVVISPFKRDETPSKYSFIYRNSIMAAVGQSVLIIEARRRSGVFYTVNAALDLGRTIMAVPGDVFCFNSSGVHSLIKEGASLVESMDDIFSCIQTY